MDIVNLAVKRASALGATEAEALVQRNRTIKVGFGEEVHDINSVTSMGLGLRVVIDKRTAMYSTSILTKEGVGLAVEKAISIARVVPEDPHWKHLNRLYGGSPVKGNFDKRIEAIEYEEIMEKLNSAIAIINERDKRVKPTKGTLTLISSKVSVANSHGEALEGKGTTARAWTGVKAEEAGLESTCGEHREVRSWSDLDLNTMATSAVDRAIGFLEAKPIQGGVMPIILRNRVAATLLGVMMSFPINADNVQKGGSPFADKLGEQIAAEYIDIFDDGTLAGGLGTSPFDEEGHPTQRTPVVEGGVLKNFLYDSYTALKDDVDSTGNATRSGYSSPPIPAPTNLILERGTTSADEIIRDTKRGLYVEGVIGEWLSNPVSGNMNMTVTHGYLVEDGELGQPVKGVALAGNFHETIREGFEIIGEDTMNSGRYYSPTVKIRKLTVVGE